MIISCCKNVGNIDTWFPDSFLNEPFYHQVLLLGRLYLSVVFNFPMTFGELNESLKKSPAQLWKEYLVHVILNWTSLPNSKTHNYFACNFQIIFQINKCKTQGPCVTAWAYTYTIQYNDRHLETNVLISVFYKWHL